MEEFCRRKYLTPPPFPTPLPIRCHQYALYLSLTLMGVPFLAYSDEYPTGHESSRQSSWEHPSTPLDSPRSQEGVVCRAFEPQWGFSS